jgi:voltage-gated potassium channel
MAKLVLRPQVAAFLDIVTSVGGPDLQMEEIELSGECANAGRTIRELRIGKETGALIVALRKPDGTFDTTPSADASLDIGDVLIAVGTAAELKALEDMFQPGQVVAG